MTSPSTRPEIENPPSLKWLLYVLGGASILVTLIIVFVFLVVWMPLKSYVSEKPFEIELFSTPASSQEVTRQKVADFFAHDSTDSLILNTQDVNNLVAGNSLLKNYEVEYRIELTDSLFNLRCVVPVSKIKNHMASIVRFVKLEGFINAEMEGYILLNGQKLSLVTTRSQMNSRPAPFTLLGKRAHIELNQFFPNPLVYNEFVRSLKTIKIKEGKLVIVRA